MTRTFKVIGEQLRGRPIEEVAESIEELARELRSAKDAQHRQQLASTIMHLAADISVSAAAN